MKNVVELNLNEVVLVSGGKKKNPQIKQHKATYQRFFGFIYENPLDSVALGILVLRGFIHPFVFHLNPIAKSLFYGISEIAYLYSIFVLCKLANKASLKQ